MAEETVVSHARELAESILDFVVELNAAKGPLYLACLVQFEDKPGRWVFLVGSHRLFDDLQDEMEGVYELMDQRVPAGQRKRITKIGFVSPRDPFFREMAKAYKIGNAPRLLHVLDAEVNGLRLADTWIYVCSLAVADKTVAAKRGNRSSKPVSQRRR